MYVCSARVHHHDRTIPDAVEAACKRHEGRDAKFHVCVHQHPAAVAGLGRGQFTNVVLSKAEKDRALVHDSCARQAAADVSPRTIAEAGNWRELSYLACERIEKADGASGLAEQEEEEEEEALGAG